MAPDSGSDDEEGAVPPESGGASIGDGDVIPVTGH
jgi:hypothetical protein